MMFRLVHTEARRRAWEAIKTAPEGHIVKLAPPTRTLTQNAALWPLLRAFAGQLEWPVNGRMERLTCEEWKDILTAAYQQADARVAPGLSGGMVMLGLRTRDMDGETFSGFLDFVHSVAVDRGVSLPEQRPAGQAPAFSEDAMAAKLRACTDRDTLETLGDDLREIADRDVRDRLFAIWAECDARLGGKQ